MNIILLGWMIALHETLHTTDGLDGFPSLRLAYRRSKQGDGGGGGRREGEDEEEEQEGQQQVAVVQENEVNRRTTSMNRLRV